MSDLTGYLGNLFNSNVKTSTQSTTRYASGASGASGVSGANELDANQKALLRTLKEIIAQHLMSDEPVSQDVIDNLYSTLQSLNIKPNTQENNGTTVISFQYTDGDNEVSVSITLNKIVKPKPIDDTEQIGKVVDKNPTIVGAGSWTGDAIQQAGLSVPSEYFIEVYSYKDTHWFRFNPDTISRDFPGETINSLSDLMQACQKLQESKNKENDEKSWNKSEFNTFLHTNSDLLNKMNDIITDVFGAPSASINLGTYHGWVNNYAETLFNGSDTLKMPEDQIISSIANAFRGHLTKIKANNDAKTERQNYANDVINSYKAQLAHLDGAVEKFESNIAPLLNLFIEQGDMKYKNSFDNNVKTIFEQIKAAFTPKEPIVEEEQVIEEEPIVEEEQVVEEEQIVEDEPVVPEDVVQETVSDKKEPVKINPNNQVSVEDFYDTPTELRYHFLEPEYDNEGNITGYNFKISQQKMDWIKKSVLNDECLEPLMRLYLTETKDQNGESAWILQDGKNMFDFMRDYMMATFLHQNGDYKIIEGNDYDPDGDYAKLLNAYNVYAHANDIKNGFEYESHSEEWNNALSNIMQECGNNPYGAMLNSSFRDKLETVLAELLSDVELNLSDFNINKFLKNASIMGGLKYQSYNTPEEALQMLSTQLKNYLNSYLSDDIRLAKQPYQKQVIPDKVINIDGELVIHITDKDVDIDNSIDKILASLPDDKKNLLLAFGRDALKNAIQGLKSTGVTTDSTLEELHDLIQDYVYNYVADLEEIAEDIAPDTYADMEDEKYIKGGIFGERPVSDLKENLSETDQLIILCAAKNALLHAGFEKSEIDKVLDMEQINGIITAVLSGTSDKELSLYELGKCVAESVAASLKMDPVEYAKGVVETMDYFTQLTASTYEYLGNTISEGKEVSLTDLVRSIRQKHPNATYEEAKTAARIAFHIILERAGMLDSENEELNKAIETFFKGEPVSFIAQQPAGARGTTRGAAANNGNSVVLPINGEAPTTAEVANAVTSTMPSFNSYSEYYNWLMNPNGSSSDKSGSANGGAEPWKTNDYANSWESAPSFNSYTEEYQWQMVQIYGQQYLDILNGVQQSTGNQELSSYELYALLNDANLNIHDYNDLLYFFNGDLTATLAYIRELGNVVPVETTKNWWEDIEDTMSDIDPDNPYQPWAKYAEKHEAVDNTPSSPPSSSSSTSTSSSSSQTYVKPMTEAEWHEKLEELAKQYSQTLSLKQTAINDMLQERYLKYCQQVYIKMQAQGVPLDYQNTVMKTIENAYGIYAQGLGSVTFTEDQIRQALSQVPNLNDENAVMNALRGIKETFPQFPFPPEVFDGEFKTDGQGNWWGWEQGIGMGFSQEWVTISVNALGEIFWNNRPLS